MDFTLYEQVVDSGQNYSVLLLTLSFNLEYQYFQISILHLNFSNRTKTS